MLPLLILGLAGLPWLASQAGNSPHASLSAAKASAEETTPPLEGPFASTLETDEWLQPDTFSPGDHARWLTPPSARPRTVLATEYITIRVLTAPAAGTADFGTFAVESAEPDIPLPPDEPIEPEATKVSRDPKAAKPTRTEPAPQEEMTTVNILRLRPEMPPGTDPGAVPDGARITATRPPQRLPEPISTLLLPEEPKRQRSAQLERIAQQADRQIRHGFDLAGRKAYFAARAEFIRALRLVAQGLDSEFQTTLHSRSLAAGLAAIREADDFLPRGSALEADLNLSHVIRRHRTPLLKNSTVDRLTPMLAMQAYFTFAQEQLAAAAGSEIAGSMALQGLGKLHGKLAAERSVNIRAAEPKTMTFYQAALLVWPGNFMASNDLGVLLANCGSYAEARTALEHSITISQQSTGWHNLAEVYRQLGKDRLAQRANQLSLVARRDENTRRKTQMGSSHAQIKWVSPDDFVKSHKRDTELPQSSVAHRQQNNGKGTDRP